MEMLDRFGWHGIEPDKLREVRSKLAQLETIISRADISSIRVNAKDITVGVHGIATARQIEGATRIIQLVVQATLESSSPYR